MSEELFSEIGLRIAALRGDMTQTEFADQLDVDRKTVGQWERGERVPAGTQLIRMSEEFGADLNFILTGHSGGAAPALRPDEQELLDNYRNAPADGRERLRQIGATAAQSEKRKSKANSKFTLNIGVVHGGVAQGDQTHHIEGDMVFGATTQPRPKPK